jgi:hypothetical protein
VMERKIQKEKCWQELLLFEKLRGKAKARVGTHILSLMQVQESSDASSLPCSKAIPLSQRCLHLYCDVISFFHQQMVALCYSLVFFCPKNVFCLSVCTQDGAETAETCCRLSVAAQAGRVPLKAVLRG